ncbi:MAG: hypothetical protein COS14_07495 [Bacteroidetes bacterium CG02_land_8_20_14_3_00_31_25]|nr:nucleotidyltransferase domain-containing protein [Bacteroidota bacterium]PIV58833.1 MAG: hypothetical protein COS14_07495 [Bacteroidetes bacterium CG02_land_8_20_14_3_00_31_25]PIX34344.1 MAG: hypothetical protein COZ59_08000 [Bacteroidetes bacterium CG_4_8_14_3_um_filter_31_14]PIY05230.1 MAG: hypothetical protein COZ21_04530 [Bacteroidetes bacterium CG_4_10_14_3_um_filter_31_20]
MIENKLLLKEIKLQLKSIHNIDVKDVILFGSHAKGVANEFSDYDVCIVLKNDYDWKVCNIIYDALCEINMKYDILIDAHIISENEINTSLRGKQPIFENILNNGIYA